MVAAIRPKPSGVSSNSRSDDAVLVGLGGPDRDVPGLAVELDPRLAARALGVVVGDEEGLLDRLDDQVEREVLLADERLQCADVDVHAATPPRSRRSTDARLRTG